MSRLPVVDSTPRVEGVPVGANLDVGHTNPFFTYPVGGEATLFADEGDPRLHITRH